MDYAKRAAEMVITAPSIIGNRRGWLKVPGTDRGGVAFDVGEQHVDLAVADVRAMLAAELQAAHDAGVVEGKAGERALEMFVVRSVAHQVNDGDDRTAEQLIEMLLAERDDAVALARDAVRFVEEARNVRENLCMGVTMPNAWLDRAKALGKESGQ